MATQTINAPFTQHITIRFLKKIPQFPKQTEPKDM